MSRRVVTVTAERGTNWWALEAPEAGAVSQCKRLTQAADEMREAIAYQLGLEPDGFDIDVRVVLPEQYEREATAAAELRHAALEATAAAAVHSSAAARALAAEGMSVRDIGEIMGVSYQRAAQLVARAG